MLNGACTGTFLLRMQSTSRTLCVVGNQGHVSHLAILSTLEGKLYMTGHKDIQADSAEDLILRLIDEDVSVEGTRLLQPITSVSF